MTNIPTLNAMKATNAYVWFANDNGKIVCGQISDVQIRTNTTALVILKNIKYHPDDTIEIAALRTRENDRIYKTRTECDSDFSVKLRQAYENSINSCHELYLFVRLHNLDSNAIAASVAFDKSHELDIIRKETQPN